MFFREFYKQKSISCISKEILMILVSILIRLGFSTNIPTLFSENLLYIKETYYQSWKSRNSNLLNRFINMILFKILNSRFESLITIILDGFISTKCNDFFLVSSLLPGNIFHSMEILLLFYSTQPNVNGKLSFILTLFLQAFFNTSLILRSWLSIFLNFLQFKKEQSAAFKSNNTGGYHISWFAEIYIFPQFLNTLKKILFVSKIFISMNCDYLSSKTFLDVFFISCFYESKNSFGVSLKKFVFTYLMLKGNQEKNILDALFLVLYCIERKIIYEFLDEGRGNLNFVNWVRLIAAVLFITIFQKQKNKKSD